MAPAGTLPADVPPRVQAFAAARYGDAAPSIRFHAQCFQVAGHFAGTDAMREDALVEVANDPAVDAVWCARGGYGSNRIAAAAVARMGPAAKAKVFMGYSDIGFLLGGLQRAGVGRPVHGPMPIEIRREGGEAAIARALDWLLADHAGTHPFYFGTLPPPHRPACAMNTTVFAAALGTLLEPDLTGRELWLEDLDEAMYRIDRMMFQITSTPAVRRCAGIRTGRFIVPPNEPDFGQTVEQVAAHWCARSGIPYLGAADIGHDNGNAVVPFG